ncbi:N-acetylmuramoyl-L-alanine amidase [Alkalibacterium sp. MB6]|uniref:N-acetylmuramoyl-L-alanine amidase n=1 Tax=Alkalibacterium sp. MB6 TaxID=2081965 RepID=UPI0013794AD5|nr:N-acetylmuramoyl-L-alanine amidase [Alkalibacterium sp. MB6]
MGKVALHNKRGRQLFIVFILAMLTLLLTSIVALANENKVTVLASTLNVRYGPGLSHEILTQVQEDAQLNVLGEENEWYKVRLHNDQVGWVASWLIENDEVSTDTQVRVRVTSPEANVRQFASTDSEVIGTVFAGEEYQLLYRENDWTQILYQNRVAWIHSNLLEVTTTPTTQAVVTPNSDTVDSIRVGINPTNIRRAPSTDSDIVTTISEVTEFAVVDELDDWYQIELPDGQFGFVASWVTESVSNEVEANLPPVDTGNQQHYAVNLAEATIVIDAGHGGHDPGAVSSTGVVEKEVALNTAMILANKLRNAGSNVIMTRNDDTYISLNDRVYHAHQAQADAFISIHYDSVEVANTMSGTTTYYYSESEKDLAEAVNHYLTQFGPLNNNGVRFGDYAVLRINGQPSILLELGYMNNDHDLTMINTTHYQQTIADAIYQALSAYFSP